MARNIPTMDVFCKNLNYLLKSHNMSAKELAIKTGITPKAISEWMNGHAVPKQESVERIAKAFNYSADIMCETLLEPDDLKALPIGDRITRLRAAKGFTIKTLSNKSGLDRVNIGKIEANQIHPRPDTLYKIAKALGVNVTILSDNQPKANKEPVKSAPSTSQMEVSATQRRLIKVVAGHKLMMEFLLLQLTDEESSVFREYLKFLERISG